MGLNYYIEDYFCPACGASLNYPMKIHLGKSSSGWKFNFAYNDGEYYTNVGELMAWLNNKKIVDEYGALIPHSQFWVLVASKQNSKSHYIEYGKTKFSSAQIISGFEFTNGEFS